MKFISFEMLRTMAVETISSFQSLLSRDRASILHHVFPGRCHRAEVTWPFRPYKKYIKHFQNYQIESLHQNFTPKSPKGDFKPPL